MGIMTKAHEQSDLAIIVPNIASHGFTANLASSKSRTRKIIAVRFNEIFYLNE
jgi:hypothetical protein